VTGTGQLPEAHAATPAGKPRARSLGIPFDGTPGPWNAITDVPGVAVGYVTVIEGDSVRTGVTGIHPRGPANAADPVAAGFFSLNGNGEMTGVSWIAESGTFALPVAITNTHAVGVATPELSPGRPGTTPNSATSGRSRWPGRPGTATLNDAYGHHITEATVIDALEAARSGPVEKARWAAAPEYLLRVQGRQRHGLTGGGPPRTSYTVGVFLQANFGSREELTLGGVRLGRLLTGAGPVSPGGSAPPARGRFCDRHQWPPTRRCSRTSARRWPGGSPTASRAPAPSASHFSGDLFLAFSTANPGGSAGITRTRVPGRLRPAQVHPLGADEPVLRGGRARDGGGRGQRPGRE